MPADLPEPLRARRRRLRIGYTVVVALAVAAVAATMAVVIGTGEAAHATLSTGVAAAALPDGSPAAAPGVVWSSTDHPAEGDPLWNGTVVTWSQHQLSGRDALTGQVRWSYRRTDLDVCDAAQQEGRAFVLFRRAGNCDELSTFNAGTGARGWFRTLPDDGTGRMLLGTAGLVIVYPASFHAIDPTSGIERYPSVGVPGGCTISSAVAGTAGILLTQHCASGDQLVLHDNFTDKNQPLWHVDVAAPVRAVAAGQFAVTYDPSAGTVQARGTGGSGASGAVSPGGTVVATPALTPAPSGPAGPTSTTAQVTVLQLGSALYTLGSGGQAGWSVPDVRGPAEAADTNGTQLLVATPDGASRLDATSGAVLTRYRFTTPATGSRVYPAGSGLLVVGPGAATAVTAGVGSAGGVALWR